MYFDVVLDTESQKRTWKILFGGLATPANGPMGLTVACLHSWDGLGPIT
jgi:hypothetical protein